MAKAKAKQVKYRRVSVPVPRGDSPKHLFQVTVVVLADARWEPEDAITQVMSACAQHPVTPMPVVDGYGAKVTNLTLSDRKNRVRQPKMVCTAIVNKPIPRGAKSVDVIEVDK